MMEEDIEGEERGGRGSQQFCRESNPPGYSAERSHMTGTTARTKLVNQARHSTIR